jgi:hypothetical protein
MSDHPTDIEIQQFIDFAKSSLVRLEEDRDFVPTKEYCAYRKVILLLEKTIERMK